MRLLSRSLACATLFACAALPSTAFAQASALTLDATIGPRGGSGGSYGSHAGISADLLLAYAPRTAGTALIGGLGMGGQAAAPGDLDCTPVNGECRPDLPGFATVSVLLGVQHTWPAGQAVRALAGPAMFGTDSSPDRDTGALLGRLDAASAPLWGWSLVASLQGVLLPSFAGEQVRQYSVGVGLRLR